MAGAWGLFDVELAGPEWKREFQRLAEKHGRLAVEQGFDRILHDQTRERKQFPPNVPELEDYVRAEAGERKVTYCGKCIEGWVYNEKHSAVRRCDCRKTA